MYVKKEFVAIVLTTLFCSALLSPVQAQETSPKPQAEIASGGIGDAGMDNIKAAQKNFSLKLIFSNPSGQYLADVNVSIADKQGDTVLDTHSVGPVLLVKLEPGTYSVTSSTGASTESKTIKLAVYKTGLTTHYIHLKDSDS